MIEKLRPMDDLFFTKLVERPGFCEEVLQVILQKELVVIKVEPQKVLRNLQGRSVTVDVLCKDSDGNYYNIEIQKQDNDDHQRRVRYNGSNMDTFVAEKGIQFKDLPEVYVIYISRFDFFGDNKTIYHIDRVIRETGKCVDNGFHEIYVNTYVDDGTEIADLMKIFESSEIVQDERFPAVCKAIQNLKHGRGRAEMNGVIEEYAKEYAKKQAVEIAKVMLEHGETDFDYISTATKLSLEEIQEIADAM